MYFSLLAKLLASSTNKYSLSPAVLDCEILVFQSFSDISISQLYSSQLYHYYIVETYLVSLMNMQLRSNHLADEPWTIYIYMITCRSHSRHHLGLAS